MDRELLALIDAKMALADDDVLDFYGTPSGWYDMGNPLGNLPYSHYAHYYAPLGYTGDLIYTTLEEVVSSALDGYPN